MGCIHQLPVVSMTFSCSFGIWSSLHWFCDVGWSQKTFWKTVFCLQQVFQLYVNLWQTKMAMRQIPLKLEVVLAGNRWENHPFLVAIIWIAMVTVHTAGPIVIPGSFLKPCLVEALIDGSADYIYNYIYTYIYLYTYIYIHIHNIYMFRYNYL